MPQVQPVVRLKLCSQQAHAGRVPVYTTYTHTRRAVASSTDQTHAQHSHECRQQSHPSPVSGWASWRSTTEIRCTALIPPAAELRYSVSPFAGTWTHEPRELQPLSICWCKLTDAHTCTHAHTHPKLAGAHLVPSSQLPCAFGPRATQTPAGLTGSWRGLSWCPLIASVSRALALRDTCPSLASRPHHLALELARLLAIWARGALTTGAIPMAGAWSPSLWSPVSGTQAHQPMVPVQLVALVPVAAAVGIQASVTCSPTPVFGPKTYSFWSLQLLTSHAWATGTAPCGLTPVTALRPSSTHMHTDTVPHPGKDLERNSIRR